MDQNFRLAIFRGVPHSEPYDASEEFLDGHAVDTSQCLFGIIEFERLNDRFDFRHGNIL